VDGAGLSDAGTSNVPARGTEAPPDEVPVEVAGGPLACVSSGTGLAAVPGGGGSCGWGAGSAGSAAAVGWVSGAAATSGAEDGGAVAEGGGLEQEVSHSGSTRAVAVSTARTTATRLPPLRLSAMPAPQSRPGTFRGLTLRPAHLTGNVREVPVGTRVGHGRGVRRVRVPGGLATPFPPTDRSRR
jgi:hypothetical protein